MPKVSVIIPVYNTEKYIRKCLDSVCNQTLSDIEIICVNDCSPDNSLEILKEYAQKDNRIKIIDFKENKGAAVARNKGIDEATGEFVGFVDSDDFIDLDFYEKLYVKAVKGGAEVVKGSDMKILHQDGHAEIDLQNEKIKKNKINFWCQYTTAIYKREFILKNDIKFPMGLLVGEDPVFAIKTAFLCNKIDIINDAQYYYARRENSLNSEYWNIDKVDSYIEYINIVTSFALNQDLSDNDYRIFFGWVLNDIFCTRNAKGKYDSEYYNKLNQLYNDVRSKIFKFPIKLLYDAKIFVKPDKRGIYWVAYNILKELKKDKRFEITLWLEGYCNISEWKKDEVLKDLNVVYSYFALGEKTNYKIVKNKNFNPLYYDAYFNPAHNAQFSFNCMRPAIFNVLHDTIPMLKEPWFTREQTINFWKFYSKLTSDVNCFCVSQSCKEGFLRFFDKLDEEKMIVAYNSTAQNFYPEKDLNSLNSVLDKYNVKPSSRGDYIFYFGAVNDPRKNIIFNIKCFIEFIRKNNIQNLYFYIGGLGGDIVKEKFRMLYGVEYPEFEKYIVPLGFVDDEDVNRLYSNSKFFSFLSLYEGFGMPPLEAMQAGVPVVCANNSSLPEVVGDSAILVDASNKNDIVKAFEKVYYDEKLRNELVEKGLERAKMFTWSKTVQLISNKIIKVLSGGKYDS